MEKDAYHILDERLAKVLSDEFSNTQVIQLTNQCSMCNRKPEAFDGSGFKWRDSYKTDHEVCDTCIWFCEQFINSIGVERGNIGYKLSSFKNGYLTLPFDADQSPELWLGGKYPDRIVTNSPFKVLPYSGHKAAYELLERIGDYQLVIQLGLRKELYLRYLRLSTPEDMFIANALGGVMVNKKSYQAIKDGLLSMDLKTADLKKLVSLLRGYKTGRKAIDDENLQKALAEMPPETIKAIYDVASPHAVLFILDAVIGSTVK